MTHATLGSRGALCTRFAGIPLCEDATPFFCVAGGKAKNYGFEGASQPWERVVSTPQGSRGRSGRSVAPPWTSGLTCPRR